MLIVAKQRVDFTEFSIRKALGFASVFFGQIVSHNETFFVANL